MVEIVEVLSEGIVVLTNGGNRALWTRCKLRKPTRCILLRTALNKGDEAWRPIGNQSYRMNRLSMDGMSRLVDLALDRDAPDPDSEGERDG